MPHQLKVFQGSVTEEHTVTGPVVVRSWHVSGWPFALRPHYDVSARCMSGQWKIVPVLGDTDRRAVDRWADQHDLREMRFRSRSEALDVLAAMIATAPPPPMPRRNPTEPALIKVRRRVYRTRDSAFYVRAARYGYEIEADSSRVWWPTLTTVRLRIDNLRARDL